MQITVEAHVPTDAQTAWDTWHDPDHIVKWNSASDDWHTPTSSVDLREGGQIVSRMEARDGSSGFDFVATYTKLTRSQRTCAHAPRMPRIANSSVTKGLNPPNQP